MTSIDRPDNHTSNIFVSDDIPDNVAGQVTFWSAGRDSVDFSTLFTAWDEAGLDHGLLLDPPTPKVALRLAVQSVCQGHSNRFRRGIKGGGWVVVTQHASDDEQDLPSFEADTAFSVNAIGVFQGDPNHPLFSEVETAYQDRLHVVTGSDISKWLASRIMRHLRAVCLRDNGGVYMVSRDRLTEWETIRDVVKANTAHHVVGLKAAMGDTDLVANILQSLQDEMASFVAAQSEAVEANELTARGWNTRQAKCEEKRAKLREFSSILGDSLDGLNASIDTMETAIVAAAMVAGDDDDLD